MDIGTAGPLVLHVLGQACSQQPEVLKPAEQQLKQWETQPGFYTILQVIHTSYITPLLTRVDSFQSIPILTPVSFILF